MTTKPDPPKRPMNAVFLYLNDHRASFSKANPNLKLTEVTSKLSEQYKSLSAKEKEKYEKAYEKAKLEFEKVVVSHQGKESLRR